MLRSNLRSLEPPQDLETGSKAAVRRVPDDSKVSQWMVVPRTVLTSEPVPLHLSYGSTQCEHETYAVNRRQNGDETVEGDQIAWPVVLRLAVKVPQDYNLHSDTGESDEDGEKLEIPPVDHLEGTRRATTGQGD